MGRRPIHETAHTVAGPLKNSQQCRTTLYKLYNVVSDKFEEVHVKRLKEFKFNSDEVDPLKVAAADADEFIIEKVLDHEGDPNRKSTLDFLIKWEGYDDSANLWIPWKEVRLNPKVHDYLLEHGLGRLIPH